MQRRDSPITAASGATPGSRRKTVEFVYQYKAGKDFDDTLEKSPLIQAWIAGIPPPVSGGPVPVHRHQVIPLGKNSPEVHTYAPVQVSLPYSATEWPEDTSVRFLIFDQIQNSEGDWTYEKAASGEVFMADLLANPVGKKVRTDMRVQSYYMATAEDRKNPKLFERKRHKGVMYVTRRSTHPDVTWAKPTGFELTPTNYASLQAAMMMAVGRSMSPFNSKLVGKRAMQPTLPNEIDNVHAPLYVQETPIGLDGATFFSFTPTEAAAHVTGVHQGIENTKTYYETLIQQSLRRHDMSEREFVKAGEAFAGGKRRLSDHRIRIAAAAFATTLTQRVNMMEYVADKVVLGSGTHQEPIVESFDQVDGRTAQVGDFGGARSKDLVSSGPMAGGRYIGDRASSYSSSLRKRKPSRNVASGGAMDCEDGAKDAAIHFSTLTDRGVLADAEIKDRPLLVAARRIGQKYRAVSMLTSVLSRNLSDATQKGSGNTTTGGNNERVTIGSREDMNVKVGAHMFTVLIPESTLKTNIARAMKAHQPPSSHSRTATTGSQKQHSLRPTTVGSRRIGAPSSMKKKRMQTGDTSVHPIAKVDLGSYGIGSEISIATGGNKVESSSSSSSRGMVRIGSGVGESSMGKSVLKSGKALPALLCEGTGILHPLMVPWDGYEEPTDIVGRKVAITRSMLSQEAELRMRVGKGSDEVVSLISGKRKHPHAHPSMSKFKAQHTQKELVDHPDTRLVETFYRTVAEAYLNPTAEQIRARVEKSRSTGRGVPKTNDGGGGDAPVLVGDRLIPVQIGDRYRGRTTTTTTPVQRGKPTATWGVAVSDILRSSELVGFLPTPHPSAVETQIVQRVGQHIAPPASAWHLDTEEDESDPDADPYILSAKRWPTMFAKSSTLPGARAARKSGAPTRYIMAHAYGDPRKLDDNDIVALGQWMRKNRYVVGASLDVEYATYHLATVRLDALIDCGATAQENQPHIEKLLENAPKRPPLPIEPVKVRDRIQFSSSSSSSSKTQTVYHRKVVARFRKNWMTE